MQDDALPAEVAGFLQEASSTFAAEVPAPGRELRLLFDAGIQPVAPTPTRRPSMLRSKLATVPAKLAIGATGLTFAFSGLAAANALPTPVQQVAADLGDVVGVDVPVPGTTTPPTDDTATPSADDTATPPTDDTATPPTDDAATPPTDDAATPPTTGGTTTPPTTGGTTTPTTGGATAALPPPATSANEAAHIHDFDAACGNHGRYVSAVARTGTEPSCATTARGGTTTTSTTAAGAAGAGTGGEPADTAKGHKPAKASTSGDPKGRPAKAKG